MRKKKRAFKNRPTSTPPKPIQEVKKRNHWATTVKIAGGISLIIGLIIGPKDIYKMVKELFTTKEDSWKEQNYISGINIPLAVNAEYPYLNIKTGGLIETISIEALRNGYTFPKGVIYPGGCTPFNLELLIKGNNIYASTTCAI